MIRISLVPHHKQYAEAMALLSSAPEVKDALGLTNAQTTLKGTTEFIEFIQKQEEIGKQYSRVILNEQDTFIGVITLKDINHVKKTCHIGTWIGHPYWGKGYNALAKENILTTAFLELQLNYVFAGAKLTNTRSIKAQEKLPYITINVQAQFPDQHKLLEEQVKAPCILNVIEKERFLSTLNS